MPFRRDFLGFVVAPLPAVAPLMLWAGAILFHQPKDSAGPLWAIFQLVLLCYAPTLLVGVPVHLLLQWRGRTSLITYSSVAVATVLIVFGVLAVSQRLIAPVSDNPHRLMLWGGEGVLVALGCAFVALLSTCLFWTVAIRTPRR